jgi:hypothetical protein
MGVKRDLARAVVMLKMGGLVKPMLPPADAARKNIEILVDFQNGLC